MKLWMRDFPRSRLHCLCPETGWGTKSLEFSPTKDPLDILQHSWIQLFIHTFVHSSNMGTCAYTLPCMRNAAEVPHGTEHWASMRRRLGKADRILLWAKPKMPGLSGWQFCYQLSFFMKELASQCYQEQISNILIQSRQFPSPTTCLPLHWFLFSLICLSSTWY